MRKYIPAILWCLFSPAPTPSLAVPQPSAFKNKGPMTRSDIVPSLIHKFQQRICPETQPTSSQLIYLNIFFVLGIHDPMMVLTLQKFVTSWRTIRVATFKTCYTVLESGITSWYVQKVPIKFELQNQNQRKLRKFLYSFISSK